MLFSVDLSAIVRDTARGGSSHATMQANGLRDKRLKELEGAFKNGEGNLTNLEDIDGEINSNAEVGNTIKQMAHGSINKERFPPGPPGAMPEGRCTSHSASI